MNGSSRYLYQEIAESLRRRIASGELEAGDRLPPVRKMAQQWECTPGTISRAYGILANEGLVAGRPGSGTHVLPNRLEPETTWRWANLVNRAERYLLETLNRGFTPAQSEAALSLAISRWQELRGAEPPPVEAETTKDATRLRLAGSHDLAVDLMTRLLTEEGARFQLDTEYMGSLGGLIALAQDTADIAGTHLWDETTDTYNLPYVQRLLPGRRVVLLTLAHRSLGLMTTSGNPHQVQSLADLAQPGLRLVNRQSGSGTRVWLDAQLKALDIEPQALAGYEREEVTHTAVARAIDEGEADVGLGIFAAAAAYGLEFIPLAQERYDLVLSEALWQTEALQFLVAIIRSDRFKASIAALGGYDTTMTGQETWE